MSISTLDGYIGAAKQVITWNKTTARTTVAAIPFSLFDVAGNPGAGTLSAGNTANGIVPTDATAGYPAVNSFGGAIGYLSKVTFASPVACRFAIYDRVFSAGAYSFNSNVTLASQPSYSARLPGTDYKGLELWLEAVTAFTGNQSIAVTYTDQDGNASATTGTIATGVAPIIGRMLRLNLAAGDSGIQKVDSVVSSVATVGTFNVHVMRKLWEGRVPVANSGDTHDMLKTGLPQIYDTSALFVMVTADSTSSSTPTCDMEIAYA